jgi:protein-disulfide isomerase
MTAVLDQPRLTVPISGRDHVLGPAVARLTLLEYGDYECPYCRAAHAALKQVIALLNDSFKFAYRHFPLSQIHPHAAKAAEAAEAAAHQESFWQMHDRLFENQDRLDRQHLVGYAAELGLDTAQFALELDTHVHAPRVREDFMSGIRSGVNGTPTFFINGVRHNGGYDVASLTAALRAAL